MAAVDIALGPALDKGIQRATAEHVDVVPSSTVWNELAAINRGSYAGRLQADVLSGPGRVEPVVGRVVLPLTCDRAAAKTCWLWSCVPRCTRSPLHPRPCGSWGHQSIVDRQGSPGNPVGTARARVPNALTQELRLPKRCAKVRRPVQVDPARAVAEDVVRDLPPLLTIMEAAALFRCSSRTIRRWISVGRLQTVQIPPASGRMLVPRRAIATLLETSIASDHHSYGELMRARELEKVLRARKRRQEEDAAIAQCERLGLTEPAEAELEAVVERAVKRAIQGEEAATNVSATLSGLLTVSEAAAQLRCSERYVRRLINMEKLASKAIRVGRANQVFVEKSALESLLAAGT